MTRAIQLLITACISVTAGAIGIDAITPDAERVAGHVSVRQVLTAAQGRALLDGVPVTDAVPAVIADLPERDHAELLTWDGEVLTWRHGGGCTAGRAVSYGEPVDVWDCAAP